MLLIGAGALNGQPGGFSHIIFIASFAVPKPDMWHSPGLLVSVLIIDKLETFSGKWTAWIDVKPSETQGQAIPNQEGWRMMFNDLPEWEQTNIGHLLVLLAQTASRTRVHFVSAHIRISKTCEFKRCTQYVICLYRNDPKKAY